jgi:hypothetical protein
MTLWQPCRDEEWESLGERELGTMTYFYLFIALLVVAEAVELWREVSHQYGFDSGQPKWISVRLHPVPRQTTQYSAPDQKPNISRRPLP